MKEVFEDIIKNKKWKDHLCGPGSTMNYTQNIRKELPIMIEKFKIKSILDLPCGDFSWMSTIKFPGHVKYIGADIVEFMINENRKKYPEVDFRTVDLTTDRLPDVDLLICRDCLLHLNFTNIEKVLKNISDSNINYILMSNWFEQYDNYKDIRIGKGRGLNFLTDPYNFSAPLYSITDFIDGFPKREMLLWSIDQINQYIKTKV